MGLGQKLQLVEVNRYTAQHKITLHYTTKGMAYMHSIIRQLDVSYILCVDSIGLYNSFTNPTPTPTPTPAPIPCSYNEFGQRKRLREIYLCIYSYIISRNEACVKKGGM